MIKRPLREVLALPATAAEERLADRHIKQECDRIRATWSARELLQRAGVSSAAWSPPEVHRVADPVDVDPPGA